jgi:hypothetical protein
MTIIFLLIVALLTADRPGRSGVAVPGTVVVQGAVAV